MRIRKLIWSDRVIDKLAHKHHLWPEEVGEIGGTTMTQPTVADLTVDEFKDLIREIVTQTIVELFDDPDEGLELREDIKTNLQRSLAAVQAGGETIPAQAVAAKLGLDW